MVIDFRRLNANTVAEPYPVMNIEDVLDKLRGAKIYSTLDMKSGYWQLEIEEASKIFTAFNTSTGHYEFNRVPFGLKNAPNEFLRVTTALFQNILNVQIYFDDIIVYSESLDQHLDDLKRVFKILNEVNLKLNKSKCFFAKSRYLVIMCLLMVMKWMKVN